MDSELPGPVAVAYEAGPTGFGLYRALTAAGIRCEVVAPSKLQRPAGDRVKTDARERSSWPGCCAWMSRLGVDPERDQEAARDLVRAREDCRGDLMRARHRLSKLLLRHGIVYTAGRPGPMRTIGGCTVAASQRRRRRRGWPSTPTTTTC